MSGSGGERKACKCALSRCLSGKCICFKAKLLCIEACSCDDCKNNMENKDQVDSRYNAYLKVKSRVANQMCRCKKNKCASNCSCIKENRRCTARCKCQNCTNVEDLGGGDSDTSTEEGQGSAGGANSEERAGSEDSLSNVPDKELLTLAPPKDTGGSGSRKRPRNKR